MAYSSSSGAYAPQSDNDRESARGQYEPPKKQHKPERDQTTFFFAKRSVAAVTAALLILGSTAFSVNRTLGADCREIADSFYTGVVYDGYQHPSISSQLEVCSGSANGLAALAANYPDLEEAARQVQDDRDALISSMRWAANADYSSGVDDIAYWYQELTNSVNTLVSKMEHTELTERDQEGLKLYKENYSGAQSVIATSGYNEAVREFTRNTLNDFPARLLVKLFGIDVPELFT